MYILIDIKMDRERHSDMQANTDMQYYEKIQNKF